MRRSVWIFSLALFAAVVSIESRSLSKRETYGVDLDPAAQEIDLDENLRDKRHQDVKFGVKNAILGFVFNPSSTLTPPTSTKKITTTPDIVIFEKNKPVSLEFPNELFGSSFNLVTNLSTTVGDFMINSALRAHRLLESMRPFIWKVFGKKGIVIEATTDKPIFSDGSSS